jgi:hypothetical protein
LNCGGKVAVHVGTTKDDKSHDDRRKIMTWRWREFCCKNADLRKWNKKIIIGSGKGEDLLV